MEHSRGQVKRSHNGVQSIHNCTVYAKIAYQDVVMWESSVYKYLMYTRFCNFWCKVCSSSITFVIFWQFILIHLLHSGLLTCCFVGLKVFIPVIDIHFVQCTCWKSFVLYFLSFILWSTFWVLIIGTLYQLVRQKWTIVLDQIENMMIYLSTSWTRCPLIPPIHDSGHYRVLYVTPEYVDVSTDFLARIHQSSGQNNCVQNYCISWFYCVQIVVI